MLSFLKPAPDAKTKVPKDKISTVYKWRQVGVVNTDLKLSEITGLKMYFFTGLNAALHVVPCNLSYDMICQKF